MILLRAIRLAAMCVLLVPMSCFADEKVSLTASEPIVLKHPHINKSIGNPVYCLAFVNGGEQLATGAASGVLIWDVKSGNLLHTLEADNRGVDTLVVDPRGRLLVAGTASGVIKVWDTRGIQEQATLGPAPGAVLGLAISPDGKLLASISPNGVQATGDHPLGLILWDLTSGRQLRSIPHPSPQLGATSLAFTAGGKQLISGQDRTFRVIDVSNAEVSKVVELPSLPRTLGTFALAENAPRLVTGVFEPKIRIWNAQNFQELLAWNAHDDLPPPRRGVSTVGFSQDGKYVISGGMDGQVCMWDSSSGRRVLHLDGRGEDSGRWITGVTFTPDNQLLAASHFGGSATIWRITQAK